MYMHKHLETFDVKPLLEELGEFPELWDRYTLRTTMFPNSPHRDVHDIWLRYRCWSEFNPDKPEDFANEHQSIWYSSAYMLRNNRQIVKDIFELVGGEQLGGALTTRIPAGKCVYPHSDAGA